MYNYLFSSLAQQDMFGHQIEHFFMTNKHCHYTWLGALISILIKLFMVMYITFLMVQMIEYKEDLIETVIEAHNMTSLGSVKYKDLHLDVFPLLFNSSTHLPLEINSDTKRYISVSFEHTRYDFT